MQREVEDLARSKEFNNLCPYYLDLQDEVLRMQVGAGGAALSVPAPRCLFFGGPGDPVVVMAGPCSLGVLYSPGQLQQSQQPLDANVTHCVMCRRSPTSSKAWGRSWSWRRACMATCTCKCTQAVRTPRAPGQGAHEGVVNWISRPASYGQRRRSRPSHRLPTATSTEPTMRMPAHNLPCPLGLDFGTEIRGLTALPGGVGEGLAPLA